MKVETRLVCPQEGQRIQFWLLLRAKSLIGMAATSLLKPMAALALEWMKKALPYLVADFLENSVDITGFSRYVSMRSVLSNLYLKSLHVIHAGEETFQMEKRVRGIALSHLLDNLEPLR